MNVLKARALAAPKSTTAADLQEWFADHQRFRWNQVQHLANKYARGEISVDSWYTAMDDLLLGGHSDAWFMGRFMGGDDSEFGEDDLIAGRGYRDAETRYLQYFASDLEQGRYLQDGELMLNSIKARARLYIGKMRGTANEGFVASHDDDALFYWELGGTEDHCLECPELHTIFDGVYKSELYTTPGAGDTPCLGNCLCHLRVVVSGVSRYAPRAVDLAMNENGTEE